MVECTRNIELFFLLCMLTPDFRTIMDELDTDPKARMMHSHKDVFHCCYNVQTAVDSKNRIIWDYQVTNHIINQGILLDFSKQIKSTLNKPFLKLLADKGYDCKEEILSQYHPRSKKYWRSRRFYHGAHYVLCKGIEKVTAELGLSLLSYN